MDNLAIIRDYKNLAIPLDMIAKKHRVSTHYVLKVVHYISVEKPALIAECKQLIKEM